MLYTPTASSSSQTFFCKFSRLYVLSALKSCELHEHSATCKVDYSMCVSKVILYPNHLQVFAALHESFKKMMNVKTANSQHSVER